jgi:hypothetical protein
MTNVQSLGALGCVLVLSSSVAGCGAPLCKEIQEGMVQTQATSDCESPVGLCFDGVLRTRGPLKGRTHFTALTVVQDPNNPAILRYTGELVLTLSSGHDLVFSSEGQVDLETLAFVETDVAISPGVEGTLTIEGVAEPNLSGFTGQVTGELCALIPGARPPHAPRR